MLAHVLRIWRRSGSMSNGPKTTRRAALVCERRFGPIPAIYAVADICRTNLLVEIEGVAFSRDSPRERKERANERVTTRLSYGRCTGDAGRRWGDRHSGRHNRRPPTDGLHRHGHSRRKRHRPDPSGGPAVEIQHGRPGSSADIRFPVVKSVDSFWRPSSWRAGAQFRWLVRVPRIGTSCGTAGRPQIPNELSRRHCRCRPTQAPGRLGCIGIGRRGRGGTP